MVKRYVFPKTATIRKTAEYQQIYTAGKKYYGRFTRLYCLDDKAQETKIGIVVTRKIRGSVIRNRYKRLVREYYRLHRLRMADGKICVVVISQHFKPANFGTAQKELEALFTKANIFREYPQEK